MDSFEWNKIAGWVLAAAIAVLALSIVTGFAFHDERPEEMGYFVDVPEEAVTGDVDEGPSIIEALQTAEVARGENVFKKCTACHNVQAGGPNGTGPNLYGVVGRDIAGHSGFAYSSALSDEPGSWTWEKLDEYLESPRRAIPGNTMSFAGISKVQDRAHLLAYLNRQSGSPLPMPEYVPPPEEVAQEGAVEEGVEAELADAEAVPESNIGGPAAENQDDTDAEDTNEAN